MFLQLVLHCYESKAVNGVMQGLTDRTSKFLFVVKDKYTIKVQKKIPVKQHFFMDKEHVKSWSPYSRDNRDYVAKRVLKLSTYRLEILLVKDKYM